MIRWLKVYFLIIGIFSVRYFDEWRSCEIGFFRFLKILVVLPVVAALVAYVSVAMDDELEEVGLVGG